MNSTIPQEFKFRKLDIVGFASAEDDLSFLKTCFVETDEYRALKDQEDLRQIVLGRTGSGKSALFERLKMDEPDRVISLEPHDLALTHISNSTIIRYLSSLQVNLDPFYKLLWRHVLTVEILKKHFEQQVTSDSRWQQWSSLFQRFQGSSMRDKEARQAIEYLRRWGEKFWVETEYRVKEITTTLEKNIEAGLKAHLPNIHASSDLTKNLTEEEKSEIVNRSQHIVSEAQVQDLNKTIKLLEGVLSDRQKSYYVIIDRLDEQWVEEKLRYRLIMALMDSIKEITHVPNVKILLAIRRDLIDRVFRLARSSGFQEEKYQSLYLPLSWSPDGILELLDKRVGALVARRYQTTRNVTHRDLLPRQVEGSSIREFVTRRAARPRDVISFFNKCIEAAEGRPKLNKDSLKHAEGEYSRQRLRALADEWNAHFPGLLDFTEVLKSQPSSFSLNQIQYNAIADMCLKSAIEHPTAQGVLRENASKVSDALISVEDFKRTLFMIFYRIGLVGLKLETYQTASWNDESGQMVSPSEIDDTTSVVIHTTYHRALGIKPSKHR